MKPKRPTVMPPDGTYWSKSGAKVRVVRRPVPDSTLGSIEIALLYGRGGAAREQYFLEHHKNTQARVAQVFNWFLNDISPLGEPYPVRSPAQKAAFDRVNERRRSKACA